MRLVDWKMNEGKLQAGMVVKMPSGDICYVVSVSPSSALIRYVSGYDKPITTRKGVTKIVTAHRHDAHISLNVCILCVDPNSEYALRIREKMTMTEAVAEQTTETTEKKATRATRTYTRTEKQPEKELKGQGAIVLAKITEMGSGTILQVAEACKGMFKTRQTDERIVGFYLSKFKREGFVSTADGEGGDEPEVEVETEAQPE